MEVIDAIQADTHDMNERISKEIKLRREQVRMSIKDASKIFLRQRLLRWRVSTMLEKNWFKKMCKEPVHDQVKSVIYAMGNEINVPRR